MTHIPTREQQAALVDHLERAVTRDATGAGLDDIVIGDPPSARYYLATLAPSDLNLAVSAQRMGRATPSGLGFEFEADYGAKITVSASASLYYSVLPTLAQQETRDVDYRLVRAFRRLPVQVGPVTIRVDSANRIVEVLEDAFADAFAAARRTANSDPRIDRRVGDDRKERLVPAAATIDDSAFEAWLAATVTGDPLLPVLSARVHLDVRDLRDRLRVTATLVNLSNDPTVIVQGRGRNAGQTRHDEARDHFLFQTELHISAPHGLRQITMDLGPDAYRYSGELPAYASNCGVRATTESDPAGGADRIVALTSVPAPGHDTVRTESRTHPACAYRTLIDDPLPALDRLADDLDAYGTDPAWSTIGLPGDLAARKELDRQAFGQEADRFRDGIRWLRQDPRLLLAFRLANETMLETGRRNGRAHPGWRLFQLVAIVSQLPALAWREHPEGSFTPGLWGDRGSGDPTGAATVIWYPTGGGKTEAYLGLVVTAMFYDRCRGKYAGVTAWCRFPLRLLSLQQTQRQLDVVATADDIRDSAATRAAITAVGGDPGQPFRVGFFAGAGNTPNSLSGDSGQLDALRTHPKQRMRYRLVDTCPYCQQRSIDVPAPDPVELRLRHVCTNPECGRQLPIVVVDTEVYRYLPAVIVGTLDKLAGIGLSDRFGSLLGDVDCLCPVHGYGRGNKCHERRSPVHPNPKAPVPPLPRPLYDASPTLEIIDELHMVDEELGAFSGHYEGLLAEVQRNLGRRTRPDGRAVRAKVVATSATIRGEDRQCEHLFGLPSVVVPQPGPSLDESFYWKRRPDQPHRRFVGVMPTRSTAELTLVRILTSLHTALRQLQRREALPVALVAWPPEQLAATIDLYQTSLTYVTSLVDFAKIRRSLDTQVNETLRQAGYEAVSVAEMKGETAFDTVRANLDDLEQTAGQVEAVVATSMVSHGVDIARLNLMVFNGMPRAMAEYIQASSRVGRTYHGLIFMIFNPVRERDRSHFRYHSKFHDYLDRMVEPVAINRWSRFAVRRTLPGLLMGEVLQVGNRAWWNAGGGTTHLHELARMKRALLDPTAGGLPEVQEEELLAALGRVYLSDRAEADELRRDVETILRGALATVRAAGAAMGGGRSRRYVGTADNLGLNPGPMLSLRDVAEGLPFITLQDRGR